MDIGKFLKSPEFDIRITTYRDIFQVEALESDRFGEEYMRLSAAITMSRIDMQRMGIKEGNRVRLYNNYGSIVVEATESKREEPGGLAFMVNSPWSNALVSAEWGSIPRFKNINAKIQLSKEEITTLENLINHVH